MLLAVFAVAHGAETRPRKNGKTVPAKQPIPDAPPLPKAKVKQVGIKGLENLFLKPEDVRELKPGTFRIVGTTSNKEEL